MNNHHPLCYNDEWVDDSCELCWVINYVFDSITPPCDCGTGMYTSYYVHHLGCKYGAFMYSQDKGCGR